VRAVWPPPFGGAMKWQLAQFPIRRCGEEGRHIGWSRKRRKGIQRTQALRHSVWSARTF